jgi:serine/threonine protein kinase
MNALGELSTDLTTPLPAREILNCFEELSKGRCSLPELNRWVLERCRSDGSAASGVLLLLEDYGSAGKLRQYDFRPLQRELQRLAFDHDQQVQGPFHESDTGPSSPQMGRVDLDPTGDLVVVAPVAEDDIDDDAASGGRPGAPVGPTTVLRGRYVLQDEIGRGGVGTVYRALDRNRAGLPHEHQYVALKVLRDEHAHRSDALNALRREFHQAQSLSHPGIVNVFDFDHDNGTYFVTMELLDGEPLGALMRRVRSHTLPREVAIRILRELGDAIAYAHERDVLHMDLKPGNVMVAPQGQVRVLDFGLAQTFMAEPWISDSQPIPPAATPAYASCERLLGELPDVRDDIYSFACLAYEVLSGEHPFDRRSALVARGEGCKPRRIRGLSRRQWRALKRGLAWAREDRPDSMQELLDDLASPSTASRRSTRQAVRPRRRIARRPLAALALLVLGVAAALSWSRLPNDLREAVAERAAAAGQTFAQTIDAARTWATAWLATFSDDAEPRAASVTPPTPASAPQIDPAGPVVAPPPPPPQGDVPGSPQAEVAAAPQVEDPAPETPRVAPAATHESPEPVAADPAPLDKALPAVPLRAGGGPGMLEFTSDTFQVSESGATARLSVRRRGGAAGEISFGWHTVDDSALAGEDYAPVTVREVMAPGQTTATLLVPIVADAVAEHTELLDVVIEDVSGARLGSVTRVPVIIVDDD